MAFKIGNGAKNVIMILFYTLVCIAIPVIAGGETSIDGFPQIMIMTNIIVVWIIIVIVFVFD